MVKVYAVAPWRVRVESEGHSIVIDVSKSTHRQRATSLNYGPKQATAFIADILLTRLMEFIAADRLPDILGERQEKPALKEVSSSKVPAKR